MLVNYLYTRPTLRNLERRATLSRVVIVVIIVTMNMILRVPRLTHEQKENETDSPMRAMCVLPILLVIESWTKNLRMFA